MVTSLNLCSAQGDVHMRSNLVVWSEDVEGQRFLILVDELDGFV